MLLSFFGCSKSEYYEIVGSINPGVSVIIPKLTYTGNFCPVGHQEGGQTYA